MARVSPPLVNFNAGEWGPLTYGRVDLPKYRNSLRLCKNFIPKLQGPLETRTGSTYAASVLETGWTRLIPFVLSRDQAFMFAITTTGQITVNNSDGSIQAVTFTGSLPTGVSVAQMKEIQYAQDGDTLYLVQQDKYFHKIEYAGGSTGTITEIELSRGPFRTENTDTSVTLQPDSVSGTGTMDPHAGMTEQPGTIIAFRTIPQALYPQWTSGDSVSSGDYRWNNSYTTPNRINVYKATSTGTTGDLGPGHDEGTESDDTVTWQFVHTQYGFIRLDSQLSGSPFTYNYTVVGYPEIPGDAVSAGTFRFSHSWYAGILVDQYPASIAFDEQRMILAGGRSSGPYNRVFGSRVGDYENFSPDDPSDSGPFSYQIASGQENKISWVSASDHLLVGTLGGEYRLDGGGDDLSITPTNVRIKRFSRHGCAASQPVQAGNATMFLQAGGATLREAILDEVRLGYRAANMSLLAHHLCSKGMRGLAYQAAPSQTIWTVTDDGLLLGFTYDREEGVSGWHQHVFSGTDSKVLEVAILPDADGIKDYVWVLVERTIDGATTRYVEILNEDNGNPYLDSATQYSGAATNSITSATRHEGETLAVVADGSRRNDVTVSGSAFTVSGTAATDIWWGYPVEAEGETQSIEGGSNTGVSQGKSSRIHRVAFRLYQAGIGLEVGFRNQDGTLDGMQQVSYRKPSDPMDAAVPEFTGDTLFRSPSHGYDDQPRVYFRHLQPSACTINAIWVEMDVYDER